MTQNTTPRDLRAELERDDGTYPDSLLLKSGEIFAGTLRKYTSATTQYGDAIIAVVDDETNGTPRSLWLIHEVLRREFARQKPRVGERLAVKYHGKHAKGYHGWSLLVDREDDVPNFADATTEDTVEPTGDWKLNDLPPEGESGVADEPSF